MAFVGGAMDKPKIEQAVQMILEAIGADLSIKDLADTPARVAKMYEEIFAGMRQDGEQAISVILEEEHDEIILVRDIPFYSMCEHHLVPFFGKAHVAYLPDKRITGLSKLARVVDVYAKRPQVQERMTSQIADAIMNRLKPQGVMVVLEAQHMCMIMRGVQKPGAVTTTSVVRGVFREEGPARQEVLSLIYGK
jgi:GTP cyclohydrolase I